MCEESDINIIRANPKKFPWGTVQQFHDVGPYSIVEYVNRERCILFSVYVNGEAINHSSKTIEGALLYAISFAHTPNGAYSNHAGHMAKVAMRVLGVKED